MPFCSNCGNENPVGVRFCSKCGTEQVTIAANCPNCGKTLEGNEKFCSGCGAPVFSEPIKNEVKPVKPESTEKEGKFTKEGRKIIDAGPKPNQFKPKPHVPLPPTSKHQKKKRSFMGCLGKMLLIILILMIVGVVIIWNLADEKDNKLTDTDIPGIVDIKQEKGKNISVTDKSPGEKKNKKTILDANDPDAADKYRYGIGVDGDQYKAFELYEKLADKGDLNAMIQLSDYYEQGVWVKKDSKKAKQLLKKAADAGSITAKWQLEFLESENKPN